MSWDPHNKIREIGVTVVTIFPIINILSSIPNFNTELNYSNYVLLLYFGYFMYSYCSINELFSSGINIYKKDEEDDNKLSRERRFYVYISVV